MSNPIRRVEIIDEPEELTVDTVYALFGFESALPEKPPRLLTPNADGRVPIQFDWSGVWSDQSAFNGTLERFAEMTRGCSAFAVYWSDGTVSGLRIRDGKVSWHKIDMTLGDESK